ncbi:hypothetical protein LU08_05015 [Bifidobacterium adolescentis]|nr:hypothetical protein LU08_05015 [Bifidobacterium adolescentis]
MPVLVALCVLLEGMFFMTITKPGHVPDIWTHVYRIDSILNGDVIARPVTSRSMLHNTETGWSVVRSIAVGCSIPWSNMTDMIQEL